MKFPNHGKIEVMLFYSTFVHVLVRLNWANLNIWKMQHDSVKVSSHQSVSWRHVLLYSEVLSHKNVTHKHFSILWITRLSNETIVGYLRVIVWSVREYCMVLMSLCTHHAYFVQTTNDNDNDNYIEMSHNYVNVKCTTLHHKHMKCNWNHILTGDYNINSVSGLSIERDKHLESVI